MYFRILSGKHVEGTGEERKVYTKGDIVKSSLNLCKLFRNKFEKVSGKTEVSSPPAKAKTTPVDDSEAVAVEVDAVEVSGADEAVAESDKSAPPAQPRIVTSKFEGAKDAGVIVEKSGRQFTVKEAEGGTILTDPPLRNRKAVEQFIETLLSQ
jgi:hypothetical protein